MENLLNENALASVSAEELMKIGIQESDAVFLKLDEATWGALDELSRSLQTCESTAMCLQCHGCRVRHAIYAHQMYSIQQLRSNIDNVEMLPLGTRMHIRHWQQQPQNHCGELEAAAPNGAEAVHDLLQLDFFVSSAGISFCVSCNNEILKESLRCLGCPARCHHACWRMARHTQWQELVFVCLLCRAQKPDLNSRARLAVPIKSPLPAPSQRCLDCGADPRREECVICCSCGGCFCADTCAMLGLRVVSGPFHAPPDWNCRYCSGFAVFDESVCRRLDELVEPAIKKASDEGCLENVEAMTFFQMMFAASDQQAQRILDQHGRNLEKLILLEKRKAESNPKYMMAIEPMQLLSFCYPWLTEQLAYVCANSHALHFYDRAQGSHEYPSSRMQSHGQQRQTKKKIGILTSDWGPHPTKEMLDGPLRDLNAKHFQLFFFLLKSFPIELKALKQQYGDSQCILLTSTTVSDLKKAKKILATNLDGLIFLDGHTNNGRGVFGELEKTVVTQNLSLKLYVWCAFPGVYGGVVSRTIVCPITTKDKAVYAESKTAEMECYHVRPQTGPTSREQMLQRAASHGLSRKSSGIPDTALVLGYPGRLGRFSIATQKDFATLIDEHPALYLYFVTHTTSWHAVLNVFRSLRELGVPKDRMIFGQALPAEYNNERLAVLLDAAGDIKDGYGLHSMASLCTSLGVPVVTKEDTRFHNNPAAAILRAARLDMLCADCDDHYLTILRKLLDDKEFRDTVKSALTPAALERCPVFNSTRAAAMLAELLHRSLHSDDQHISSVQRGSGSDAGMAVHAEVDSPSPNRLLQLIRRDSRWRIKMEQDPSLQAHVEAIEQVLKTIAPSAEFDSILELRENLSTLVIGGSASLGTGSHAKHITVVIKAKSDSAAVRREHVMMTHTRIRNFCLPKTYPIFAARRGIQFSSLFSGQRWNFIAMEQVVPWMKPVMELACREFRDHGRILDEWQHVFYQLFDAIMYLQASKLKHGKISFEHVMRHPVSGRLVLIGYDCAQFYSDEEKGEQLKPAQGADIVSAGMMLLEPLLERLEDSEARRAREDVIWGALQDGVFSVFLGCVQRHLPPTVNPIHKNSGQHIMERIAKADKKLDPVMQIRRDTVLGLLQLAFRCGTSQGEICARQALLDGFLVDYIPKSAEGETILVTEGVRFTGQFTDSKSGKVQKDSLVLLVPDQGLQVVALLDTASDAPVGYYGGLFGSPGQNHHLWSAARCRLHLLPADSLAIDGCPSGPHLFLEDLVEISAPGSLFASSSYSPDDSIINSGNVAVPSRCGALTPLPVRDLDVRGVMMYSSQFIRSGSVYAWPYNWARISGANAYSKDEIKRRQVAFGAGLPNYTKSIISKQRDHALAAGGFDDAAPS
jgi:predicted O-linked N-acetylglucosamine transferase (SPINDLY family)